MAWGLPYVYKTLKQVVSSNNSYISCKKIQSIKLTMLIFLTLKSMHDYLHFFTNKAEINAIKNI